MSCYADGGVFARRTISCASAPCSAPSSPRSRVKFLCSHGGKILPRPSDGQLKYVGGETRVISVPRDISFQELMKRLTYLIEGGMVLKYQLVTEDLDALVTVKTDEDLAHMLDEMEHYQMMGFPRMRTFLFPTHSNVVMDEQLPLDQRYIFSINGIITPTSSKHQHPPKHPLAHSLASSSCTSPRSPDDNSEPWLHTSHMHKIQSSPNICNLAIPQQQQQQLYSPQHQHQHQHHHQLLHPQYYHNSGYRSRSARFQQDNSSITTPTPYNYYPNSSPSSTTRGGNSIDYCTKCMHHDNCAHFSDRIRTVDRLGTLP